MKAGYLSTWMAALLAAAPMAALAQNEGDVAPPSRSSATLKEIPPDDEALPADAAPPADEAMPGGEREPEKETVVIEKSGDVLSMPEEPRELPPRRVLPHRGLSMGDVERQYGSPRARHPAVGQPPITRWDYDGFSVFFEHRTVLHAVQEDRPAEIVNRDELIQP